MATREEVTPNDIKNILNILVSKIESYEDTLENIEARVSELSVIKHQMEMFTKQVNEIQSDLKSLRSDFQNFKSVEYKVEDLSRWKNQIEQVLTIADMQSMKLKSFNQELLIAQLNEKLINVKEEIKKETMNRSLVVGGGAGSAIVALAQALLYVMKQH